LRPIHGDRKRLARAIGHLVDNAIAASKRGQRILVQASQRKAGGGEVAEILVKDEGVGLDSRSLTRALDGMKVRADGKSVDRRQGLGLPLARQLVEAHGGTLRLESTPGKGTSAIVELP
jgi:signal transduction histidine kinase